MSKRKPKILTNKDIRNEAINQGYYKFKKNKKWFMLGIIIIQSISIVLSYILCDVGFDFGIYFKEVHSFWNGESDYSNLFLYLNYFFVLFIWVYFLPILIALIIHIILTDIMFYIIIKEINKDAYGRIWFLANFLIVLWYSATFNINIWIAFSFIFYQKYRDRWWSPFILLLGFFKITSIAIFCLMYLINLYYERRIEVKLIPAFLIIMFIVIIGLFYNLLDIYNNVKDYDNNGGILVAFQAPHLIWISIPIMYYLKYSECSIDKTRKFWFFYFIITISFCLLWLIFGGITTISNYLSGNCV